MLGLFCPIEIFLGYGWCQNFFVMMKKVIKLFCHHNYICVQLSFSSIFNFDLIFGPFWTPLSQPIFGVVRRLNTIQENTHVGEPFYLYVISFYSENYSGMSGLFGLSRLNRAIFVLGISSKHFLGSTHTDIQFLFSEDNWIQAKKYYSGRPVGR